MIVVSYLLQLCQCPVLGHQVVDIFYSSITQGTVRDASVSNGRNTILTSQNQDMTDA